MILAAYLFAKWQAEEPALRWTVGAYLVGLTGVLVVAIRATHRALFQVTPQDLLILFLALAIPNLSGGGAGAISDRRDGGDAGGAVLRERVYYDTARSGIVGDRGGIDGQPEPDWHSRAGGLDSNWRWRNGLC